MLVMSLKHLSGNTYAEAAVISFGLKDQAMISKVGQFLQPGMRYVVNI